MSNDSFTATTTRTMSAYTSVLALAPHSQSHPLFVGVQNGMLSHHNAITEYFLPEAVTKTSANGMTVTYELEVFL